MSNITLAKSDYRTLISSGLFVVKAYHQRTYKILICAILKIVFVYKIYIQMKCFVEFCVHFV